MIRFRTGTTLEVIENFNENTEVIDSVEETFKQGEMLDADIFSTYEDRVDVQFANGSVALGVFSDTIEEI